MWYECDEEGDDVDERSGCLWRNVLYGLMKGKEGGHTLAAVNDMAWVMIRSNCIFHHCHKT